MFVAIDLPERIAEGLAALDPQLAGLRWARAEQAHLTLCFLGTVADNHERMLLDALAGLHESRFPLTLRGMGCFTRHRQPAVIWVGVAAAPPPLFHLQHQMREATLAAGLTMDSKPFHPHITVGRCKNVNMAETRDLLKNHAGDDFGTFEVTGFTLYASILHPEGAEHLPVFRQEFEGA